MLDLTDACGQYKPMTEIKSICVYCGSSPGDRPIFKQTAQALGKTIAQHNIRLVYGGGTNGLMGAVARAVIDNGGKVTGILPEFLMAYEASDNWLGDLDELIKVKDMHTRKHMMFEKSDAFVTLPGGIGTLEEVIEMMTWAQLGRHRKPIVLANVEGFWDPLTSLLDHMQKSGFLKAGHGGAPLVVDDPIQIVPAILEAAVNGAGNAETIAKL